MQPLEPIPIPAAIRWREFRTRIIPFLVVFGIIGAIAVMWRNRTGQASMQGIGEGFSANITAPQVVRVEKWLVEPHSVVQAGTALVLVAPADARAEFDRLRALYELARVQSQTSPAEDNAMNYERLRIELLKTKTDLAIAKVKFEQAERDVARNTPLYREKLVSADIYEMAVSLRDALQAEVREWSKAIAQIEQRMEVLRSIGEPSAAGTKKDDVWLKELETAQEAAIKNLEPHTLPAPITGMVSVPIRQAGEFVQAGEPLMTVSSTRAENIVAYLRQPYRFDPQVGMTARITTRTSQRQAFSSQITQIGAQIEVLTNALALMRPGMLVDAVLPVILPVPSGVNIRPGEIVDVTITEPGNKSSITAAPAAAPHL